VTHCTVAYSCSLVVFHLALRAVIVPVSSELLRQIWNFISWVKVWVVSLGRLDIHELMKAKLLSDKYSGRHQALNV